MEKDLIKVLKETLSSCFNRVIDVYSLGEKTQSVYDLESILEVDAVYYKICRMPWHSTTERSLHIMVLSTFGFSGACVSCLIEDLPCSSFVHIDCIGSVMDMHFHVDFK